MGPKHAIASSRDRAGFLRRRAVHFRSAFSLLEVLLVLSLLVVMGSLSWPALQRSFANQRLQAGADTLQICWARARLNAIKNQTPYLFQCVLGENRYRLIPYESLAAGTAWASFAAEGTSAIPTSTLRSAEQSGVGASDFQLPEGVVFADCQTEWDTRTTSIVVEFQNLLGSDGLLWSDPILFYPDGTATTAVIVLENQWGRQIDVQLRGLTGTVTVGRPRASSGGDL